MSGYIGTQPVPQSTQTRQTFTATASQTSFATGGYQAGYLDVFLNGVKLVDGTDYTATNGSDVVLTTGAASGDTLEVVAYTAFTVLNQNFTGGVTVDNDAATVLTVDRATSDGTIIDLKKDGFSVGRIGVGQSDDLYIGTDDTGLLTGSNDTLCPWNPSTNTGRDSAIDLGTDVLRFKDLYLSGGVYLGGTGSANKLDDYEEGTWTPSYTTSGTQPSLTYDSDERPASYTKIGNMVYVIGTLRTDAASGGSGTLRLSGLPFASSTTPAERPGGFTVTYQTGFNTNHPTGGYMNNDGSTYFHILSSSTTASVAALGTGDLGTGTNNNHIMFYGQYRVNA